MNLHWLSFIGLLVKRDLKIRYRESVLGYLWSMLNPLLTMTILTLVVGKALRLEQPHYPVYVLSGLLCWNLFSQGVATGVHSVVNNGMLLRKVKVPALVFPTASISSAAVNMLLSFLPFFAVSRFVGQPLSIKVLQVLPVVVVYFFFIEGIVLFLSSVNVFFRDVGHVIENVLQILFYATPIMYPVRLLPDSYRFLIEMNPVYFYVKGFRAALYENQFIALSEWCVMFGTAALIFTVGYWQFRRVEQRFHYYL